MADSALMRLVVLIVLAFVTACGATAGSAPPETVSLAGWFHVVWNVGVHFELLDDRGRTVTLEIDEDLARRCSGVRAFNRKRVLITGEPLRGPAAAVRVLSIQAEDGSVPPC